MHKWGSFVCKLKVYSSGNVSLCVWEQLSNLWAEALLLLCMEVLPSALPPLIFLQTALQGKLFHFLFCVPYTPNVWERKNDSSAFRILHVKCLGLWWNIDLPSAGHCSQVVFYALEAKADSVQGSQEKPGLGEELYCGLANLSPAGLIQIWYSLGSTKTSGAQWSNKMIRYRPYQGPWLTNQFLYLLICSHHWCVRPAKRCTLLSFWDSSLGGYDSLAGSVSSLHSDLIKVSRAGWEQQDKKLTFSFLRGRRLQWHLQDIAQ